MSSSFSTASNVAFLPLGAILQEFKIGGRNIVQNFPTAELYAKYNNPFFGETIGRVANRISGAKIDRLNGQSYALVQNNGPNSLHGGELGFGKREFDGPTPLLRNGKESVLFKYLSPDGDQGYPGALELRVWYTASMEGEKTVLEMEYEAELVGDDNVNETVVGITNHSYFNLANTPTIAGTVFKLATNLYQEVDSTGIPTGPIKPFPGIKENTEYVIGETEPDIDDCFILNTDPSSIPVDTRSLPLQTLASFKESQDGGVHLEVLSTEPAFQFYLGKFINVPAVPEAGLPARGPRSGFCVEPSRYVNAVNIDEYRPMVALKRGEKWGSKIVYKGWVA
ncbi:galactose mutarotase-like protein [Rhizodiscina lignyota]|uniref:Galactose mutarotase-like protein n=1 Tax=Rhizodiscina lignyota TaxID=1504668 RepID=A0A9P4M6V9_9PEZI|nr:galactose mutarotase-like protein [Rhizodiscina lignyota]